MVPTIWIGSAVTICSAMPVQADLSHTGAAVTNSSEGRQRSFSDRPRKRPLHYQDRVLANGWHQALGEVPVSHGAK